MSQLFYNQDMKIAQIGQLADARNRTVESYVAGEAIPFGRLVVRSNDPAKPNTVRLPRATRGTVTFDANLIASNVVNGKVNGEAITPVTYASSHGDTMTALLAAIEALSTVKRAALMNTGSNNRDIVIETTDEDIVLADWAVTLGVSQATIATAESGANEVIAGVAMFSNQVINTNPAADPAYAVGDVVNVLSQGSIWVPVVTDYTTNDPESLTAADALNPRPVNAIVGTSSAGVFCHTFPGGLVLRKVPNAAIREITTEEISDGISGAILVINLPGNTL